MYNKFKCKRQGNITFQLEIVEIRNLRGLETSRYTFMYLFHQLILFCHIVFNQIVGKSRHSILTDEVIVCVLSYSLMYIFFFQCYSNIQMFHHNKCLRRQMIKRVATGAV